MHPHGGFVSSACHSFRHTPSGHSSGHTRRVFRSVYSEYGMKTREGDGFFDRRLAQEMPMFVVTAVKPDGRHVVYLTARSGIQSPWIAPNEIGTGRQIVNGFVASELCVGVTPHTRSVVLSTIDERV